MALEVLAILSQRIGPEHVGQYQTFSTNTCRTSHALGFTDAPELFVVRKQVELA